MRLSAWRRGLALASVVWLWAGAFSFTFSLWLFHGRRINRLPAAAIETIAFGGATRPYSARLLVPWTARALVSPIPFATRRAWVDRWIDDDPEREKWLAFFRVGRDHAIDTAVALCLDGLALLGFMFALRRLFVALFDAPPWVSQIAPVISVLLLPMAFGAGGHFVYDFPALLAFTLALDAVLRGSVGLLYVILPLGTLNKETMVLALIALLLPEFRRRLERRWSHHLIGLTAIVGVARLTAILVAQPAQELAAYDNYLRNYFFANLLAFARDPLMLHFERVAAALLFTLLVFGRIREKPRFLVRTLPIVLAFVALYLWGGLWGEIRALYDVYPILFLMGFQTFATWLGLGVRARPDEPAELAVAARLELSPLVATAALIVGVFTLAAAVVLGFATLAAFGG